MFSFLLQSPSTSAITRRLCNLWLPPSIFARESEANGNEKKWHLCFPWSTLTGYEMIMLKTIQIKDNDGDIVTEERESLTLVLAVEPWGLEIQPGNFAVQIASPSEGIHHMKWRFVHQSFGFFYENVCQRCIYQKLTDEGETCCPVCRVYLGADPVKKLRVDHILREVREKLFPFKKKKVNTPKAEPSIAEPSSIAESSTVKPSVEEPANIEDMTLYSIYLEVKSRKAKAKKKASASSKLKTAEPSIAKTPMAVPSLPKLPIAESSTEKSPTNIEDMTLRSIYLEVKSRKTKAKKKASASSKLKIAEPMAVPSLPKLPIAESSTEKSPTNIEDMTLRSIYLEVKSRKDKAKRKASASCELNGKQIKIEGKEVGHSGISGERDQE